VPRCGDRRYPASSHHTVRALKDAGHEVVIVAGAPTRRPKGDRVTFVQADLTSAPKLADAFAGVMPWCTSFAIIQERGRQTSTG